jgi:hypothetical protein
MNRKYLLFALVVTGIMAGCATSYHPLGSFASGGYSEVDGATPDRVTVRFDADQWTQLQRARDFALLRAGELCQQRGYSYLSIVNEDGVMMSVYEDFPSRAWISPSGRAVGFTSPEAIDVDQPHVRLEIQFSNVRPMDATDTFAASAIIEELREKYRI